MTFRYGIPLYWYWFRLNSSKSFNRFVSCRYASIQCAFVNWQNISPWGFFLFPDVCEKIFTSKKMLSCFSIIYTFLMLTNLFFCKIIFLTFLFQSFCYLRSLFTLSMNSFLRNKKNRDCIFSLIVLYVFLKIQPKNFLYLAKDSVGSKCH